MSHSYPISTPTPNKDEPVLEKPAQPGVEGQAGAPLEALEVSAVNR
jgi:hypothetical protein